MLLGASNYWMQCLSVPSRWEIDEAHNNRQFLEIGIPNIHNIFPGHLSTWNKIVWIVLGLSSLPLHLWYVWCLKRLLRWRLDLTNLTSYNSTIFSTISAQNYGVRQFNLKTKGEIANKNTNSIPQTIVNIVNSTRPQSVIRNLKGCIIWLVSMPTSRISNLPEETSFLSL